METFLQAMLQGLASRQYEENRLRAMETLQITKPDSVSLPRQYEENRLRAMETYQIAIAVKQY